MSFRCGREMVLIAVVAVASARAETAPVVRSFASAMLSAKNHNYFIESEVQLPLYVAAPWAVLYQHRETTPFLDVDGTDVQAELLYQRDELAVDFQLCAHASLRAVAGRRTVHFEDRAGMFSAYTLGGGIGSPVNSANDWLRWSILAGAYADRRALNSDWWADVAVVWRVWEADPFQHFDTTNTPAVVLAANIETANDGGHIHGLYRIGPELELRTGNGNEARVRLQWYRNGHNEFFGLEENGMLIGLEISSPLERADVFDARTQRQRGWVPLVYGGYDAGFGGDRRTTRLEIDAELVDFHVAEQLITLAVWYETRQEHRIGDFDNVSYSVALGLQSPIGLASIASHGDPLVVGADFLHRSDHALNPANDRVLAVGEPTKAGVLIPNGSINVGPRFRLQTIGWDLPYRDPTMYEPKTEWLNLFDWRVTAGWIRSTTRERGSFAGQLGLNWDVATVQGYVVYARGTAAVGEETPDWDGELGVRRPVGKIFARYEKYGINRNLGRGEALVVGLGVNL